MLCAEIDVKGQGLCYSQGRMLDITLSDLITRQNMSHRGSIGIYPYVESDTVKSAIATMSRERSLRF